MGAGKFFKRALWRWRNLTLDDFLRSYNPAILKLPALDIERYRSYEKNQSDTQLQTEHSPFILIKPSGVCFEENIRQLAAIRGLEIEHEKLIDNYTRFGIQLYRRPYHTENDIINSYIWFALDEHLYPDKLDRTKCLFLAKDSAGKLAQFKKYARLKIGHVRFYRVICGDVADEAFSSFIHVPDKQDMKREYSIAISYKNEQSP
jgi:hypothetical protein